MIPPDLASRLKLVSQDLPSPVQAVTPAKELADVLSDLSAGQKILAEIQGQLPNGSYRAMVAQREITLALPFSAKAGDTLELEVQESDGKLSLAFVANRSASVDTAGKESVTTSLSKTGNLIGNLLGEIEQQGGKAKPAALNANQPIIANFPEKASDLAPILKDALTSSGMFYEAHQARWVEGKLTVANLRQEPQGKLSSLMPATLQTAPPASTSSSPEVDAHIHLSDASMQRVMLEKANSPPSHPADVSTNISTKDFQTQPRESPLQIGNTLDSNLSGQRSTPIPADITPLVQQQLNALATQTYVWQGQVWPGQQMHWEITEDDGRARSGEEEVTGNWQTRLKLNLPNLGGIDARIGLDQAGRLSIALRTNQEDSQGRLQNAANALSQSLQASGLQLNKFIVAHGEITA